MTLTFQGMGAVRAVALGLAGLGLAGCSEFPSLNLVKDPGEAASDAAATSTKLVERDVEAPEVFNVTEAGLWDGRPSLGGVWVAHPDVTDPERVIIRNSANGKFVIGALFRRERDLPGPRLQASSDAAAALGMLAGAPVELNVTALRREAVPQEPEPVEEQASDAIAKAAPIKEQPLDPIAGAAAAIEAAEPAPVEPKTSEATVIAAAAAADDPIAPAPEKPAQSKIDKAYIQLGIFSVESNANRTAAMMRAEGMVPTVYKQQANGKTFWRVVVGPATSTAERKTLLSRIKSAGFTDAYAVNS
ncbi:MAG: SPOR domain-containing protein [Marinibacterium sp.]